MTLHPQVKDRLDRIERVVIETQEPGVRIIDKTGPLARASCSATRKRSGTEADLPASSNVPDRAGGIKSARGGSVWCTHRMRRWVILPKQLPRGDLS